jgi:hypothetical protein
MYINRMGDNNKFLFRLEPPQQTFLDSLKKGIRGHVTRQCLEIGALLAAKGLLTPSGLDMDRVQKLLKGSRR